VLSLIARRFHPDYLPTLSLALVSEEPVIRVQAAAVAAKIRGGLAARAEAALAAAADLTQPIDTALSHIAEAEKYVASGLMEEPDKVRAMNIIDGLLERTASRIDRLRPDKRAATAAASTIERYESRLLANMRLAEFRHFRRHRAWFAKHGLRFRGLARRNRPARPSNSTKPYLGAAE
jgi:hypothetical protein